MYPYTALNNQSVVTIPRVGSSLPVVGPANRNNDWLAEDEVAEVRR